MTDDSDDGRGHMTETPQTISRDNQWTQASARLVSALDLPTQPVGVWLIRPADDLAPFAGFGADDSLRFCQALMRARRGESVLVQPARSCMPGRRACLRISCAPTRARKRRSAGRLRHRFGHGDRTDSVRERMPRTAG